MFRYIVKRLGHPARKLAIIACAIAPVAVQADNVTLKSSDGTVNMRGEFIEFADNSYVIRTGLGEVRVSASRVRCEGDACPVFSAEGVDMVFAGSGTIGEGIMPLLISGYATFHGAQISETATQNRGEMLAKLVADEGYGDPIGTYLVKATASDDAFGQLLAGSAQIGMSSRRIGPEEARALREDGSGNMIDPANEHIFAVDSLVVITHPTNPVRSITTDQLRDIYAGRVTNWAQLGGHDAPITLHDLPESSATRDAFENLVFDGNPEDLADGAVIAIDNTQMAAFVNGDENAIGFVGYAFQRGANALTLVDECGLSMEPTDFGVRTGEYALQRNLYLYTRADQADAETTDFVKYAISEDADAVIIKSGFVDLGIQSRAQPLDGDRARQLLEPAVDEYEASIMREMLSQMIDYEQLSSTFRFRTGSSKLGPRGMITMERLVDFLAEQPKGSEVLLVGFTDDVGTFDGNRKLSIGRAEQVLETLQDVGGDRIAELKLSAAGFGEIAPTACNTSELGRSINRRVEIWLQQPMLQ